MYGYLPFLIFRDVVGADSFVEHLVCFLDHVLERVYLSQCDIVLSLTSRRSSSSMTI